MSKCAFDNLAAQYEGVEFGGCELLLALYKLVYGDEFSRAKQVKWFSCNAFTRDYIYQVGLDLSGVYTTEFNMLWLNKGPATDNNLLDFTFMAGDIEY